MLHMTVGEEGIHQLDVYFQMIDRVHVINVHACMTSVRAGLKINRTGMN